MKRFDLLVDSFESANRFISVARHSVLNSLLVKGSETWSIIIRDDKLKIVDELDDMARIRKEIAEKLKSSQSPCVKRAYGQP